MRFYTPEECENWLSGHGRSKPDRMTGVHVERIPYPPEPHGIFYVSRWVASGLTYRKPSLLQVTEWGIWPSSENWHLYYKLRQSHGDRRLLQDAPGHLFLDYECEDLASFLQIAMLNGWGGYLLTEADYVNMFFSHDEYVDFFAKHPENLGSIRSELGSKDTEK